MAFKSYVVAWIAWITLDKSNVNETLSWIKCTQGRIIHVCIYTLPTIMSFNNLELCHSFLEKIPSLLLPLTSTLLKFHAKQKWMTDHKIHSSQLCIVLVSYSNSKVQSFLYCSGKKMVALKFCLLQSHLNLLFYLVGQQLTLAFPWGGEWNKFYCAYRRALDFCDFR